MNILFAGSPAIAVPSLDLLCALELDETIVPELRHRVVGVLTNPDAAKGRGKRMEATDVANAAERVSAVRETSGLPPIPLFKPERLDAEVRAAIEALHPDLLVVVAFGHIFGSKFLSIFPQGGINLHPSLLPRYRGCAPIPAAILNRDAETGLSVQRLALEVDSGDLLAVERLPLDASTTTASLTELAAQKGAPLLVSVIDAIARGRDRATQQDHSAATFCEMLRKEEGLLDWSRSALELDARIRAFTPWPGTFTTHKGLTLHILEAKPFLIASTGASGTSGLSSNPSVSPPTSGTVLGIDKNSGILVQTGDGVLALGRLQYETKKALDWRSFLNGTRDLIGSRLGATIA
jgi:methionyl-tRNA formyltransferase